LKIERFGRFGNQTIKPLKSKDLEDLEIKQSKLVKIKQSKVGNLEDWKTEELNQKIKILQSKLRSNQTINQTNKIKP